MLFVGKHYCEIAVCKGIACGKIGLYLKCVGCLVICYIQREVCFGKWEKCESYVSHLCKFVFCKNDSINFGVRQVNNIKSVR